MNFKKLLGPMRFNFLILTPACVVVGIASAYHEVGFVNVRDVVLVMIGAICAHISVNAFNEYYDFKSGLDIAIKQRTPFSGGTGTLPATPEIAKSTLVMAIIALMITAIIGIFFFIIRGFGIIPLGILGLIVIYAYT
ncbi:MAG: prenyltransferase, partial [Deltaproteobacteria bacterium]